MTGSLTGLPKGFADAWLGAWLGTAEFTDCCTSDVHYEDPATVEPLHGIDELSEHAERLRIGMPDLRVELPAEPAFNGTAVAFPWRAAGTHKGDLGIVPATNKFLILHGVHWMELSHGRVQRARGFFDLFDASVQLGLAPKRGSMGETALLLLRGFGLRRAQNQNQNP